MDDVPETGSEAIRLEALWRGDFGDDYVDRNAGGYELREAFWNDLFDTIGFQSVLEVGCNVGGNLRWLVPLLRSGASFGIDVNTKAIARLHAEVPGVNAISGPGRDLPFRDRWFDLVFTMGVLIHQPDSTLPLVMSEMVRTSARWVFMGEYFAEETTEVHYRGHDSALFKRDYGAIFAELFPDWVQADSGFLSRDAGWDDVTWWLFERRNR
ncbi:MAG TPA: pseudaminic acid biosynthesis-associated methylase [Ilumatobacteraceae bacterium]|nr:pseudaminic acid biosynthesis-associated methylase [Ilumatobacteraceae bacterium]